LLCWFLWFNYGIGGSSMIDWNIVLYVGLTLIVSGFLLFLHSEKKLREIDRKIAENDRFISAMLKARDNVK
jgi:hypothetical protein